MRAQWIHLVCGLVCAWGVLTLVGCGGSGVDTIPVTGTVTLDGTPVPGAQLVFVPADGAGQAASGITDDQGKYSLNCSAGQGALAGKYNVIVTKKNPDDMAKASAAAAGGDVDMDAAYAAAEKAAGGDLSKGPPEIKVGDLLPLKYNNPATSELTVTISATEKVHDFALTTK